MRLRASFLPSLAPVALLLVATAAAGQPPPDAEPPPAEAVPLPVEPASPEPEADTSPAQPGPQAPSLPASARAEDAPVSTAAWAAHGAFALLPLGGVYAASRTGDARLWATAAETTAGALASMLPGKLLFLHPADAGGRWTDLDVVVFGAGLVLTPPLAALGTWGLGEVALGGSQHQGRAFLGALGGAAVGTLLAVAVHGLLEEVVGHRRALEQPRALIGFELIGAGATLGYQWAGGGPPRPR